MKLLSPHTHHPLALLICIFSSELASAYVTIPWQTSRYYGFDGPWQAVKANVGGFATGPSASLQWTSVDLLPGGTGGCFIPTGRLCEHNASGLCGIGGTWTPATEPVEVGSGTRFEQLVEPAVNSTGLSMHGDWQVQNLNIGGQGRLLLPAYTIPNVGMSSNASSSSNFMTPLIMYFTRRPGRCYRWQHHPSQWHHDRYRTRHILSRRQQRF